MTQIIKKKKIEPTSTQFKFILSTQQTLKTLDTLKMKDYERFVKVTQVGNQILKSVKNQDLGKFQKVVLDNYLMLPFLKLYLQEAFLDALHLRYTQIIQYFLVNGFEIQNSCDQALISVCYSLQYLKEDSPVHLFQLLLKYGAPLNYAEQQKCRTAVHFAVKYGSYQFTKLLIEYGADFNAVDNYKKTPLNYAIQSKNTKLIELLKSVNAKDDWKY